jgi:hypothetical protein
LIAILAVFVLLTLVAESIGFLIGILTIQFDKDLSIGRLVALGMVSARMIINQTHFFYCLGNDNLSHNLYFADGFWGVLS